MIFFSIKFCAFSENYSFKIQRFVANDPINTICVIMLSNEHLILCITSKAKYKSIGFQQIMMKPQYN